MWDDAILMCSRCLDLPETAWIGKVVSITIASQVKAIKSFKLFVLPWCMTFNAMALSFFSKTAAPILLVAIPVHLLRILERLAERLVKLDMMRVTSTLAAFTCRSDQRPLSMAFCPLPFITVHYCLRPLSTREIQPKYMLPYTATVVGGKIQTQRRTCVIVPNLRSVKLMPERVP